jgi:hypothetical protein
MKIRSDVRCLVVVLALVLLLPGCKKPQANTDNSTQQSGNSNPITAVQNQGGGPGVGGVLPVVGRTATLNELNNLSRLYYQYTLDHNMPPKDLEALGLERDDPKLHKLIKDGNLIVFWGVDGQRAAEGAVLAYPKDAEKLQTVPVAMCNGTAKNMSKAEFDKAPKAGK